MDILSVTYPKATDSNQQPGLVLFSSTLDLMELILLSYSVLWCHYQ